MHSSTILTLVDGVIMVYAITSSYPAETTFDLRETMRQYLSGQSILEDFQAAFALSLQSYLDSHDRELIALANVVNGLLVDGGEDEEFMSEAELRASLYRALCPDGEPLILTVYAAESFLPNYASPTITERVNLAVGGT